jgi:hypothetical protein
MKKQLTFLLFGIFILFSSTTSFSQITSKTSGNWNSASTWFGGVPTANDEVIISDGTTVTINGPASCWDIKIGQGGVQPAKLKFDGNSRTLNVSGFFSGFINIASNGTLQSTSGVSQTINVAGDFTNNGTFTQGTSNTVNMTGSFISAGIYGSNITFNNLTINNSGGISLGTDITVNNNLTLSSGLFSLKQYTASVYGSITAVSPGTSKMIVLDDGTNFGSLKYKVPANTSYLFPVGDTRGTTEYSPVTVNFASGTNSSSFISLSMQNLKDPNNTSVANYLKRAWTITPSGLTTFNYSITINYVSGDVAGNENLIYIGKYSGGVWTVLGQPNTGTNSFTQSSLTSFSTFTGGENGALPVQLSSLNGFANGRNVDLKWVTSSEINNSGFEIQRASVDKNGNASEYKSAGFVKGKGTTNSQTSYSFTDNNLVSGNYKYKLKQIDYNGNYQFFELSSIVLVGLPGKFNVSQNYPNPFNPTTKINYDLPADAKVSLVIYDISGREVSKLVDNEQQTAGYHTSEFNAGNLASGVYFYSLLTNSTKLTKQMILIK